MRLHLSSVAILLGLAAGASAQDGGKIAWKGKTDDPKAAMVDAKRQQRPMMLFFTSVG